MESLVSQTVIAFSTAPESVYGTNPVTAADFTSMVTRVREMPVTESEKNDDRGVIGRGNAMYPSYQRSGFRVPTAFEIMDRAHVGRFMPLLRRYMGKTAAAPVVLEAGIAFGHTFYEADPDVEGLQLPSSSFVYRNNEYDYLHTGCCGSTLQISQTGTADPEMTIGFAGSGNAKRIATDYPAFGSLVIPGTDPYMYGASSDAFYTDDASAVQNLTTPDHKLRSLTFTANNNLITDDTRMGMPQADATDPRRGWYRDFLHFGDREISAEFTMGMDGSYALKNAEELNLNFTTFTWTMKGDVIPTTTTSKRYQLSLVIPKFNLRAPRVGEDNQKRTKSFTIFPVTHSGHYGVYRFNVTNGVSTAIS
jgi:hypothetical protein